MAQLQSTSITGSLIVTGGITGSFSGSIASPGSNTQVLFNNSGVISANSGFVYSGGNVLIGASNNYTRVSISNGNNTRTGLTLSDGDTASLMLFAGASSLASISFDTYGLRFVGGSTAGTDNGTEFMRINTSGNIGIGQTSPVAKLDIVSTGAGSEGLRVDGAGGGFAFVVKGGSDYTSHIRAGATIGVNYFTTPPSNGLIVEGNVGIGTTNPAVKFHVQGSNLMATFRNSSTSADQYTQLEFIAGSRDAYIWLGNQNTTSWAGDGGLNIYTGTGNMDFWTAATQRMRITSGGNVGIGTTSPARILELYQSEPYLRFNPTTVAAPYLLGAADGKFYFTPEATSIPTMTLSSGNVGIGTTSPNAKLHIAAAALGTSTNDYVLNSIHYNSNGNSEDLEIKSVRESAGNDWTYGGKRIQLRIDSTYMGYMQFNGYGNQAGISFGTGTTVTAPGNVTERMRITNAGLIGIGTTNPNAKLHISNGDSSYTLYGPNATWGSYLYVGAGISVISNGVAQVITTNGNLHLDSGTSQNTYINSYSQTSTYINPQGGNVSIGTFTPSARLTVTRGAQSDTITVGNSAVYAYGSDVGLAIGQYASGPYGTWLQSIRTDNTTFPLSLNPSGGNVGIGVSSPQERLHVDGNLRLGTNPTINWLSNTLNIQTATDAIGVVRINGSTSYSPRFEIWNANNAANVIFFDAGGNSFINTGNFGVGTASPSARLDVNGGDGTPAGEQFAAVIKGHSGGNRTLYFDGGSNASVWWGSGNTPQFAIDSLSGGGGTFWTHTGGNWSERMRITSAGDIGIGTTTPSQKLEVNGRALVNQFQYTKAINYTGGDLNSLTTAGFYDGEGMSNAPNSGWFWVTVETYSGDNNWIHQTATSFGSLNTANEVYTRVRSGGSWGAWKQLGDAGSVSGTTNYVAKFTSGTAIGNSQIFDDGTGVGIGTTSPGAKLHVSQPSANTIFRLGNNASYDQFIYFNGGNDWSLGMDYSNSNAFVLSNASSIGTNDRLVVTTAGDVGIGTTNPGAKLEVVGSFRATTKSFIIDHPTKEGKKLQYGVLEGPEHSVYVRGKLTNTSRIELPDYWHALVDENSITVNLTAIGKKQELWVEEITDKYITVGSEAGIINCFYAVFAERKDVEKLVTEFDKE